MEVIVSGPDRELVVVLEPEARSPDPSLCRRPNVSVLDCAKFLVIEAPATHGGEHWTLPPTPNQPSPKVKIGGDVDGVKAKMKPVTFPGATKRGGGKSA